MRLFGRLAERLGAGKATASLKWFGIRESGVASSLIAELTKIESSSAGFIRTGPGGSSGRELRPRASDQTCSCRSGRMWADPNDEANR